jgi:hypothetical protein
MEQDSVLIFRFSYPSGDEYVVQQGEKMSGAFKSRLSAYLLAQKWADNGDEKVRSLMVASRPGKRQLRADLSKMGSFLKTIQ